MTEESNAAQTNTDADEQNSATGADAGNAEEQNNAQAQDQGKQEAGNDNNTEGKEGNEGKEGEKDEEGFNGAPESYTDFALPEGVQISDEQLTGFHEVAKQLDLNQAGAQALIDFDIERQSQQIEQIVDAHNQQQQEWIKEIKADKTLGGANFEKSMATSNAAVEKFGDDEFKALLKPFDPETNPTGLGLGNNPAFNRAFNRIGNAISEDSPGPLTNEGGELTEQQRLEKRYPNTKS